MIHPLQIFISVCTAKSPPPSGRSVSELVISKMLSLFCFFSVKEVQNLIQSTILLNFSLSYLDPLILSKSDNILAEGLYLLSQNLQHIILEHDRVHFLSELGDKM